MSGHEEDSMSDSIYLYRDSRTAQWWADMSHSDARHDESALEHGTQKRLPFGEGADWRCVRDYCAGQWSGDEIVVDILSRS
jgi:hypothetical protein